MTQHTPECENNSLFLVCTCPEEGVGGTQTRNEVVAAAKRAGYSVVQTARGIIPIEEWTPYGAKANDDRMFAPVLGFEFFADSDAPRIVDVVPPGCVVGVWPLGPRITAADSQPGEGSA